MYELQKKLNVITSALWFYLAYNRNGNSSTYNRVGGWVGRGMYVCTAAAVAMVMNIHIIMGIRPI